MKVKVTMTVIRTLEIDPEDFMDEEQLTEGDDDALRDAYAEHLENDPADFVDEARVAEVSISVEKAR